MKNKQRHGMTKTPEFNTWTHMIQRCTNPNNKSYGNYGGKGISVCDHWLVFMNFYEDMGPRPSDKHSIDRIDSSKGYSPENCRWATTMEQGANTSRNLKITVRGKTTNMAQAVRDSGLSRETVKSRISRGMSTEEALTLPSRGVSRTRRCEPVEYNGRTLLVSQWAVEIGLDMRSLLYRLNSGWSIEKALTAPVRRWPTQK